MQREVQTTHDGRLFKVQVLTWTDAQGRPVRREVVRHPGAVLIVPVLDDKNLVMIRNYRLAVDRELWEFPAGTLGAGEDPQAAALRELEEETGYVAGRVRKLGEFYTSPGFADELIRVFAAEDLTYKGQRLEPGEEIQVVKVPLNDALTMVHDGRLMDAKSVAALALYQLSSAAPARWQECRS